MGFCFFPGVSDAQIGKLRGFRIEPGEIEAARPRHGSVLQAAVIARADAGGQQRLVGYVVPAAGSAGSAVAGSALREHLGRLLPDYMVPSAFVVLEALLRWRAASSTVVASCAGLERPLRALVCRARRRRRFCARCLRRFCGSGGVLFI